MTETKESNFLDENPLTDEEQDQFTIIIKGAVLMASVGEAALETMGVAIGILRVKMNGNPEAAIVLARKDEEGHNVYTPLGYLGSETLDALVDLEASEVDKVVEENNETSV